MKIRPPLEYFPAGVAATDFWGPWIRHEGGDRPTFVRDNGFDLRAKSDIVVYVTDHGGGWGRNWSPPWPEIRWFRLDRDHMFYRDFATDINQRATEIADQVVPAYRDPRARHTGCGSHTAKRWQAAWDGAWFALGGTVEGSRA